MGQHILKNTCTKGEVTPLVHARQDLELYHASVAVLANWQVLKHGGVRRRSGTRFAGRIKYNDRDARLFTFTFSTDQSYVLEFGDEYVRFWADGGQIESAPGVPLEVATPWGEADVGALQFATLNDTIYISHSDHAPRKLQRSSHTSWSLNYADFRDGPYLPTNDIAADTVTPSGALTTGATVTLTWTSGVSFTADDVGRNVRLQIGGQWSWGRITAVTSALIVTADIIEGNGGTVATASWRLGAFYNGNWPACVTFFEGRLIWGRTRTHPRAFAASMSDFIEVFTPSELDTGTVTAEHGFFKDIVAGRADAILWMHEAPRLQLGTASVIRTIGASDSNSSMSSTNIFQRPEPAPGTGPVMPVKVGSIIVYVGRTSRTIHGMAYDDTAGGLIAPDISVLSDHLAKHRVKEMAYQESTDSVLWACDERGSLFGVTIEQHENVTGYHRHPMPGCKVESIAVSPEPERDVLWLMTEREIDSQIVRYMEILEAPYDADITELSHAYFMDCGATYDGAPASTITGIDWLEGVEVDILADGAPLPRATVVAGELTLPNGVEASVISFGIPITTRAVTLPAPAQASDGSTLGRRKRCASAIIMVLDTRGLVIGPPGGPFTQLRHRYSSAPLGQALALESGAYVAEIDSDWEDEARIEMTTPQPLPATVLAMNLNVVSE